MADAIEGQLIHDRLGWSDPTFQRIGRIYVGKFVEKRLAEIPSGAYVKLTIEVLDDRPLAAVPGGS